MFVYRFSGSVMNTTASSFLSDRSWTACRRDSIESVYSIQGKETDVVCDTSDTAACTSDTDTDRDLEYEPLTDQSEDSPICSKSTDYSEDEIISTKVVAVSVGGDGELFFADTELESSEVLDSEIEPCDFWNCAQCREKNNNPLYSYCQKCFQVRRNLFPPRPRKKLKQTTAIDSATIVTELVDSGLDSGLSQEQQLSQDTPSTSSREIPLPLPLPSSSRTTIPGKSTLKRRLFRKRTSSNNSIDKSNTDHKSSDSDSDYGKRIKITPLVKTISDPQLTIETNNVKITKKAIVNSFKEKLDLKEDLCIICFSEPKSGVFVHGRIAHICCCYKCSVKVWARAKRCPVCNCKVSNVLKAVVM